MILLGKEGEEDMVESLKLKSYKKNKKKRKPDERKNIYERKKMRDERKSVR